MPRAATGSAHHHPNAAFSVRRVHRYAADVSPQELDLAGMHACANLQAESLAAPGLVVEGGASHESGPCATASRGGRLRGGG